MANISRVYDTYLQAQNVVGELIQRGVPDADIAIIGHDTSAYAEDASSGTASGATLGGAVGASAGLLAGLGILAIPGVGPVVAAGWLASTLAGAAAGAVSGGLIGALTEAGSSSDEAHVYAEAIRRGGTLVTVRSREARDDEITSIMDHSRPVDALKRRDEYRKSGWDKFDPELPPYRGPDAMQSRDTGRNP